MSEKIWVVASESDDWAYYDQAEIDNLFPDSEERELIDDLEVGQCYHVDNGNIVIRVRKYQ